MSRASSLVADIAKGLTGAAVVSIPIGAILVSVYLRASGSPVSIFSSGDSLSFVAVAALFGLTAFLLFGFLIVLPKISRLGNDEFLLNRGNASRVSTFVLLSAPGWAFWMILLFPMGGWYPAVGILVLFSWGGWWWRRNRKEPESVSHWRGALMGGFFSCIWTVAAAALAHYAVHLFFPGTAVWAESNPTSELILGQVLVLVLFGIFYVQVTFSNPKWIDLMIFGFLSALAVYVVMPGFVGGLLLRTLGVGGDLPVMLLIKTMDGKDTKAELVHGCLVLATGSDVLLSPHKLASDCTNRQSLLYPFQGSEGVKTPHDVVRYSRSEILRVEEFRDEGSRAKR